MQALPLCDVFTNCLLPERLSSPYDEIFSCYLSRFSIAPLQRTGLAALFWLRYIRNQISMPDKAHPEVIEHWLRRPLGKARKALSMTDARQT